MKKQHYFDTGALYLDFDLVKDLIKNGEVINIPHTVMLEVSNKKDGHGSINKIARDTQKEMIKLIDNGAFNIMHEEEYSKSSDRLTNDHIIVNEIMKHIRFNHNDNAVVHTGDRDVAIILKAKIKYEVSRGFDEERVELKLYNQTEKILTSDYNGYRIITNEESRAKIWENDKKFISELNLSANEYVILKEGKKETVMRYDSSKNKLVHVRGSIKGIEPRNTEQRMAIDLLSNSDIPIKIIAGCYGSGKTFLSTNYAWEDGRNIMLVRNALGDDSSENVGFLKGTLEDKLMPYFMPIIDNLPFGIVDFENRVRQNRLDYKPTYFMKGRSLASTIMIVDEAEDINLKTFKLLGSRLAEGSEIIFSGDVKQAESKHIRDNGLQQFINHENIKNSPLVGVVVLQQDVRSEASKVFADLI